MSARASSQGDATTLFGRDKDLELLHAFVESSSDGDALLLSGDDTDRLSPPQCAAVGPWSR